MNVQPSEWMEGSVTVSSAWFFMQVYGIVWAMMACLKEVLECLWKSVLKIKCLIAG